jgi:Cerato-platanin
MRFYNIAIAILASIAPTLSTRIAYDPGYDNAGRTLDDVACSDGKNGIINKYGYTTQGAIPSFPNIGGSDTIKKWDSPNV